MLPVRLEQADGDRVVRFDRLYSPDEIDDAVFTQAWTQLEQPAPSQETPRARGGRQTSAR